MSTDLRTLSADELRTREIDAVQRVAIAAKARRDAEGACYQARQDDEAACEHLEAIRREQRRRQTGGQQ